MRYFPVTRFAALSFAALSAAAVAQQAVPEIPFDSAPNFFKLPADLYFRGSVGLTLHPEKPQATASGNQ
jgi:hypothetical protein